MKPLKALPLILLLCTLVLATPTFVQQTVAVGNSSDGYVDGSLGFVPSPGCTLLAIISHPESTSVTDADGDDGDTHLHKMSWTQNSGIIIEVWKANNCSGISSHFHIGLTGGSDTVVVQFSEWTQN